MSGPKKRTIFVPAQARELLHAVSKAALFDMVAGLAQLGTDESEEQITTNMCREAVIVLRERGDTLPPGVAECAKCPIDSDPSEI